VRVFGQDPRGNTKALAEIGFVAQDTPLYRDFTAQELISMGGKLNRTWDAALARTRLSDLGIAPNPCDYLIVLQTAHVQLSGPVDELIEAHRTLVGPRTESDQVPGVAEVIRASHTDRQSTLLARTDGTVPADPAWSVHEVTLEDLVLAYLAKADTRSTRTAWEVNA
jgi:hypothetical protein